MPLLHWLFRWLCRFRSSWVSTLHRSLWSFVWSWGRAGDDALYPADVLVIASDRSGIMKDVTEVMQREKVHVTALNTQILKGDQHMRFSLEVKGGNAMQVLLKGLRAVHGVLSARRL